MKINFNYNREKDIWCLLNKGKSSNNSQSATKVYGQLVEVVGENLTNETVSSFIEKYISENKIDLQEYIAKYQKDWNEVKEEYTKRAEAIFQVRLPEDVTAYLTINNRCPYNIEENYFFVSVPASSVRRTVMHELFHFYTWYAFGEKLMGQGISKEKYNDIKESLTVILNTDFSDLLNGAVDSGYPQHQEMRAEITKLWSQNKDIYKIIEGLIEFDKDSIEKYLMSFDDYNKVDHPTPYQYWLEKNDQILYYFGANHSYDPKDKQYDLLRKFWKEFVDKTKGKNAVVFVEGGKRPVCNSEAESIAKGSEAHFITYLASKEKIETFSPEPPEKFRFEELLKKFTKEEIVYYEFARMTYQWNRHHGEKPDFREYVGNSLKHDQKNSGWSDFDFSIDHMIKLQKEIFKRDFDENDKQFYYDVINPTTTFSRINELSRFEDSGFRDAYILKQIEKYWNVGKNLFIVYGCSHAVMHEPAIKKLIS